MEKHDFIPLCTFRGWSEDYDKWIYGHLFGESNIVLPQLNEPEAWSLFDDYFEVHPDSIGVYTGKDDKDGKPIFCGVAGAKYGGDILQADEGYENRVISRIQRGVWKGHPKEHRRFLLKDIILNVYFIHGNFSIKPDNENYSISSPLKITSTQWEEHLRADNAE